LSIPLGELGRARRVIREALAAVDGRQQPLAGFRIGRRKRLSQGGNPLFDGLQTVDGVLQYRPARKPVLSSDNQLSIAECESGLLDGEVRKTGEARMMFSKPSDGVGIAGSLPPE
jgi:hypothetical protein